MTNKESADSLIPGEVHQNPMILQVSHEDLSSNPSLLDSISDCYRDIFGGPPWNEWKRCEGCGSHFGNQTEVDSCCSGFEMVDYHPAGAVKARILKDLTHNEFDSVMLVAMEQQASEPGVTGFIWGYSGDLDNVVSTVVDSLNTGFHFDIRDLERTELIGSAKKVHAGLEVGTEEVAYISEFGVVGKKRDGILMAELMHAMASEQLRKGIEAYVSWTQRGSSIYPIMMMLEAQESATFGDNPDSNKDVLLMGKFQDILSVVEANPGRKLLGYFLRRMRDDMTKSDSFDNKTKKDTI